MQKEIPEGRELLPPRRSKTPTGNIVSKVRKLYERGRRILSSLRLEFERGDDDGTDLNPDYIDNPSVGTSASSTTTSTANSEPIDVGCAIEKKPSGGGRRPIERSTGAVTPRRERGGRSVNRTDLDRTRRSVVEVKATGERTGLVTKGKRDYSHLTLTAIKAAKDELWAKGQMPDGMILREDEVRYLMEKYFDAKPGDPIPKKLTIMGLPVKVSD